MPSTQSTRYIRPIRVALTVEEAQTLVAMRNPCAPGTDEFRQAASARDQIAAALDTHGECVERTRRSIEDNRDILDRLGDA